MNDVVERVARAIDPSAFRAWQSMYDYCIRTGDDEVTARRYANSADGPRVERAKTQARAAIAAMREPSAEMHAAMVAQLDRTNPYDGDLIDNIWCAAIDAALADASPDIGKEG